jgi:hypothetical protein
LPLGAAVLYRKLGESPKARNFGGMIGLVPIFKASIVPTITGKMSNEVRLRRSRETRLKNLKAKKASEGTLDPLEERELKRLTAYLKSAQPEK